MTQIMRRYNSQDWFPSIFNDLFDNNWTVRPRTSAPAVNVIEDEQTFKVEVAAPGMTKDDFTIHLDDNDELIISMEKKCDNSEKCDDGRRYLRREFSYSKFRQSLVLPEIVDKDAISASVADGVLTVNLPKMTPVQREKLNRTIDIQ